MFPVTNGLLTRVSRITRYVVWELLRTFLLTVTVMTVFMVMIFLVQEAWRENLTGATILELIPFIIPTALCFAIPGTILFATCIVYGRMSASNEIVAIKAMGISPTVVIWPGLVVAVLLSLCTVYLNDLSVSWGRNGIYRVVLQASAKTIYSVLNAEGAFNKGNISIVVDDVRGEDLINPHFETADARMRASVARISVDPEQARLIVEFKNGVMEDGKTIAHMPHHKIHMPLGSITKKTESSLSPSNLPLSEMNRELAKQRVVIQQLQQQLAMTASLQLISGNLMALTNPSWDEKNKALRAAIFRHHRLQTEPWRRWANGFSCFCFVIVGAPLAIQFRRFDFWSIFGICFVPVLLAYYPLLMYGLNQAKSGMLPPFVVWLGNAVMLVIGLWLISRIEKH